MKLRLKMTLGAMTLLALIFGICGSLLISASFDASLETERDSALGAYYSVQSTLQLANSLGSQLTGYCSGARGTPYTARGSRRRSGTRSRAYAP